MEAYKGISSYGKKMKKISSLYQTIVTLCKKEVNDVEDSLVLCHVHFGYFNEKWLNVLIKQNFLPMKGCLQIIVLIFWLLNNIRFYLLNSLYIWNQIFLIWFILMCALYIQEFLVVLYIYIYIYFIITNDYSRKVLVVTLKTKGQVLNVFTKFHLYVEKETWMKLKCVWTNNGEYKGLFEKYCKYYGIKLEKTILKTPQQNEVVERINYTINERNRCMLSHVKLYKSV